MVSTQKLLTIIRDVQQMVQPGTKWSDAVGVIRHIQALDQQPPSPRATWNKIVVEGGLAAKLNTKHAFSQTCRTWQPLRQGWHFLLP